MIPYHSDNRGNSRANTCLQGHLFGGLHLLDTNQCQRWLLVIHNNLADRMTLRRRRINQISALSSFEGRIEAYLAFYG
jgi:hypothetical protein